MSHSLSRHMKAAAGTAALVFLIYLSTMGIGFSEGDHAELQLVPAINGIAHEPGYGAWALMGKVFLLVPGLGPATQMNLMTVTFAVGAVFVLVFLASVWSGSLWLGICAGLVLGTSRYAWVNAVLAEVYAPQTFFVLAVFALFVLPELMDLPDPWPCWKGACLLGGWAIGFRPDSVLLVGPCLVYVLWRCWRQGLLSGLPVLVTCLATGAVPSLIYLIFADVCVDHPGNIYNLLRPYYRAAYDFLPENWSAHSRSDADVILKGNWFDRLWWLYTCQNVRWFYAATTWMDGVSEIRKFCVLTLQQPGPAVVLLAFWSLRGRNWGKRLPEVLGWCVVIVYLYSYADLATMIQEFFYPPVWGFLCCLAALGAARLPAIPVSPVLLTRVIGRSLPPGRIRRRIAACLSKDCVRPACVCLLLATAGFQAWRNSSIVHELTSGEGVREYHRAVRTLAKDLPTGAVVLGTWGPMNGLLYVLYAEEHRSDVTIISGPTDAGVKVFERISPQYPERPLFFYRSSEVIYRFIPAQESRPSRLDETRVGSFTD